LIQDGINNYGIRILNNSDYIIRIEYTEINTWNVKKSHEWKETKIYIFDNKNNIKLNENYVMNNTNIQPSEIDSEYDVYYLSELMSDYKDYRRSMNCKDISDSEDKEKEEESSEEEQLCRFRTILKNENLPYKSDTESDVKSWLHTMKDYINENKKLTLSERITISNKLNKFNNNNNLDLFNILSDKDLLEANSFIDDIDKVGGDEQPKIKFISDMLFAKSFADEPNKNPNTEIDKKRDSKLIIKEARQKYLDKIKNKTNNRQIFLESLKKKRSIE